MPFFQLDQATISLPGGQFSTSNLAVQRQPMVDCHQVGCCSCSGASFSQRTRTFVCPEPGCGARFFRKSTLSEHLIVHTGEKPFQCDFGACGKYFSTSGNLSRHRRLHNLMQYECPARDCTRVYTRHEKLVRHFRVHLGSVAYPCTAPGCSKTFASAGNLTRHMKKHQEGERVMGPPLPTKQQSVDTTASTVASGRDSLKAEATELEVYFDVLSWQPLTMSSQQSQYEGISKQDLQELA